MGLGRLKIYGEGALEVSQLSVISLGRFSSRP